MSEAAGVGAPVLRARSAEQAAIAHLLEAASAGRGGALVLHGDAGMGKTALLAHALEARSGLRILRAEGAEFEMELPHAALHQLCASVLDHRAGLPGPQRAALEAVFGLREGVVADPLLVGLAVLGLLAEVSRTQPLACVVDDAQWADAASMQALAFAARRVEAERLAFVFVVRDPDATPELAGLDRLRIAGLTDGDARALLAAEVGVPLDDDVIDRIVAEAQGNPLALLELPREVGPLALAGGFAGPASGSIPGAVERSFARRVAGLPAEARKLVVMAAAEPLGDPALLRRSAQALGVAPAATQAAEAAGLLTLGPRVRFRHPLARSAAYRSATPVERRAAHAALAEATDAGSDPDRRAWHRAQAAVEPDEGMAAELERSAGRARDRGGLAAAAAFLERAADLTPDAARRGSRMLGAARARLQSGAPDAALDLLGRAEAAPLTDGERGRARLLRALIAFQLRRDAEATAMLLDAAGGLEPDLARETYLQVLSSAVFLERVPGRLQALAELIRARAPAGVPPRPVDLLLDALIDQATLPGPDAVPAMRRAAVAFRDDPSGDPRWSELTCQLAIDLSDDRTLSVLADRHVHLARRQGELAVLPSALNMQAIARVLAGRLSEAAACVAEARAVEAASGSVGLAFGDVILAAWRGDEARVDALLDAIHARAGRQEIVAELYARTVLHNGRGAYQAALDAGLRAAEQERRGAYVVWQVGPELVEAAVRAGRPQDAAFALERIVARSRASGTDWAMGAELQSRALVAGDLDADALYREAVQRFGRSGVKALHARAQLLYGEWLRRRGRRVEARGQLRAAHDALAAMGAEGFAARAGRELEATGEHPRRRGADLLDALTPQELHIARHVASGATSKEVAAELFLSPRTIDAHLRSIFRKLGISSRRGLRDLRF